MGSVTVDVTDNPVTIDVTTQETQVSEVIQTIVISPTTCAVSIDELNPSIIVEQADCQIDVQSIDNLVTISEATVINQYGTGGGNLTPDRRVATGPSDTVSTLATVPIGEVNVFLNGVLLDDDEYAVDQNVVTYDGMLALEAGDEITVLYASGEAPPAQPLGSGLFFCGNSGTVFDNTTPRIVLGGA